MCGIYFSLSRKAFLLPSAKLVELLSFRGPDSINERRVRVSPRGARDGQTEDRNSYLTFTSTVLSLRGDKIQVQPLIDEASGSILCWNGEAWRLGFDTINDNDAEAVFSLLLNAVSFQKKKSSGHSDDFDHESLKDLIPAISNISGPFAFVFYDAVNQRMLFGRDCLGRRSLLQRFDENGYLIVSSVGYGMDQHWTEVDADGISVIDLNHSISGLHPQIAPRSDVMNEESISQRPYQISKIKWRYTETGTQRTPKLITLTLQYPPLNKDLPLAYVPRLTRTSPSVCDLRHALTESLKLRVENIPDLASAAGSAPLATKAPARPPTRLAILFSGGLDCTVLARLVHDILPLGQGIDLLNVAFENPRVVEASRSSKEKTVKAKKKSKKSVNGCGQSDIIPGDIKTVFGPARQLAEYTIASSNHTQDPYEICPDRSTGKRSFEELKERCPGRHWAFVEINVSYPEVLEHRQIVVSLIHPHNTEMDLSIALAFYFAARGIGSVYDEVTNSTKSYTTPARVLLSGLGADELFAGYSRHGAAFAQRGFPGLLSEMDLDISRLGKRNLGRDDRVIAHHGKEVRFPYLDEALLNWAMSIPAWEKAGFGQQQVAIDASDDEPHLDPEKRVLRLLAWELGMKGTARERKRAIQFGARTAKMETGKTKGTSILVTNVSTT